MTPDDLEFAMRLLNGLWPTPAPSDDELAVWQKALLALDFQDATEVMELISNNGQHWRPTVGEFTAEFRHYSARQGPREAPALEPYTGRSPSCGHSLNQVACKETVDYWVGVIRKQLAEAKGPLAKSMGKAATGE